MLAKASTSGGTLDTLAIVATNIMGPSLPPEILAFASMTRESVNIIMKIIIQAKGLGLSSGLKDYAEKKLGRIDKFLNHIQGFGFIIFDIFALL